MAKEKDAVVIDGETGLPERTPSAAGIPLRTAVDVRREQAKVYREARAGTLDKVDAAKLVWMLGEIRKSIELEEVERRLSELEQRTDGGRTLPAPTPATH